MYDPAASQATLEAQGAEGYKYTCRRAPPIQMLNISFEFPRQPLSRSLPLCPRIRLGKQMRLNGST